MLQNISAKLNESSTLFIVVILAFLASVLRTEEHTFRSILTGMVFAGFVAYLANLGLTGVEYIDDNKRAALVGCLTYLSRDVLELLSKLGASFSDDPKQALANIKEIWKK